MSSVKKSFTKFKDESEEENSEDQKEPLKRKFLTIKRKPKDVVYKDCRQDLTHLLYINTKVQRYLPHSLLPNMTLEEWPMDDMADFLRHNFPHCIMSEACPLYIAKKNCDRVDPCFRRTITREYYRKRLQFGRSRYQSALKTNRQMRKLEKEHVYSANVFNFAERLECDPDPYFHGNYDYYYTGGNLCVLSNEEQYIIHVDEHDPSRLRASIFPSTSEYFPNCLEEFATADLSSKNEIFETSPLNSLNNEMENIVGVRQRNNFTILKILPNKGKLKLITEFRTKSTPFIGFAQSANNKEMLVLTTMKEGVTVYDINRESVNIINKFNMQNQKSQITWNNIKFWRNQSFLYANERQLCVMDFRAPKEDWLNTNCNFSSKEFPCELVSSLGVSSFDNLFYVGTSHKLRCLDTRFLGKQDIFENVSVCEWTHQHDYPPLLLSIFPSKKREYIVTASPIADDIRLCELTRARNASCLTENVYKSYCLPWQPPTLQEAYENACLAGKTLQPESDLKQRIRCCTTGLAFCKYKNSKSDKALMLYSNSNGDIYVQKLQKRTSESDDQRTSERSNEIMAAYASKVSELTQPELNYTDTRDFKAMRKVFQCKILTGDQNKTESEQQFEFENLKKRFKGRWQKSMTTLYNYKDALVENILSIWDIPKEDELDIKFSTLQKTFKMENESKSILNWLNAEQAPVPATSVPISNLSMDVDDNEFISLTDISQLALNETNTTVVDSYQFELSNSLLETSFPAKTKTKVTKPKKKHVKGF